MGGTSRATAGGREAEEAGNLLESSGAESRGVLGADPEGGDLCTSGAGEAPHQPVGSGRVGLRRGDQGQERARLWGGGESTLWTSLPRDLAPDPQGRGEALRPAGSLLSTSRSVDNYLPLPFGPASPSLEVLPPSCCVTWEGRVGSLCPFLPRECAGLLQVKSLACLPRGSGGARVLGFRRAHARPRPTSRQRTWGRPQPPALCGVAPRFDVLRPPRRPSGQLRPRLASRPRGGAVLVTVSLSSSRPAGPGGPRRGDCVPRARTCALPRSSSLGAPRAEPRAAALRGSWDRRRHSALAFFCLSVSRL